MLNNFLILSQIDPELLEGFNQAAEQGPLFNVLVSVILISFAINIILFKRHEDKGKELRGVEKKFGVTISDIRKEHAEKLDSIRKEHTEKLDEARKEHAEKLDNIRKEQLVIEEKRNDQMRDNQKETLDVLHGVSNILETSEKLVQTDNKHFLDKLTEINSSIKSLSDRINDIDEVKKK